MPNGVHPKTSVNFLAVKLEGGNWPSTPGILGLIGAKGVLIAEGMCGNLQGS